MMNRILIRYGLCLGLLPGSMGAAHAQGPIGDVLKRIIMAIDLRIQRQQTQTILLQDAQKQLENFMQKTRLGEISDWVQQQKDLYEGYYQELWEVKQALQYYSAVRAMIDKQARLVKVYQQAYGAMMRDGHFSVDELRQIKTVFESILRQSVAVVDQLHDLVNAFVTQMDDGDRLSMINELSAGIDRNYRQLQGFSQDMIVLSVRRAKDESDLKMIKALYGME